MDVSNELLSKGSFHSLTVSEGHRVSIKKPGGFTSVQLKLIEGANVPKDNFVIVALDRREAGIGVVKGTHLQILPTIESGITGKCTRIRRREDAGYFEKIADALAVVYPSGAKIFVLGPGTTKDIFCNFLQREKKEFGETKSIEGSDVAGEDGVYVALRNPNLQLSLSESRLAKVSKLIAETMRRISLGDSRVVSRIQRLSKGCKARGSRITDHCRQDFFSKGSRGGFYCGTSKLS